MIADSEWSDLGSNGGDISKSNVTTSDNMDIKVVETVFAMSIKKTKKMNSKKSKIVDKAKQGNVIKNERLTGNTINFTNLLGDMQAKTPFPPINKKINITQCKPKKTCLHPKPKNQFKYPNFHVSNQFSRPKNKSSVKYNKS